MLGSWRTRASWNLWRWSCRKDSRRFEAALRDPQAAQASHLRSILSWAENSLWAREFGIDAHSTLADFRARVPVQDPVNLSAWTDRILRGETRVLSTDPVERLVPTSGTTGKPKLIPMTARSRAEFSTGVNLWLSDSMRQEPAIKSGRCYIATSPAMDINLGSDGSVPVGFAEDSAYLGRIERVVFDQVVAVPASVSKLRGSAWRATTREYLMQVRDLRFLSLWHPGYLEALFDREEMAFLAAKWPDLALVSTWADGACAEPARKLMNHFSQAQLIPKGLWLTEGVVSIPWRSGHPIALLCGFFEFERDDGSILLAHELEKGDIYRPVISNHAGLYRYRLGDLVQVMDHIDQTPTLRWIGRADQVSDLCGEKLSEAQVAQAFDAIGWTEFGVLMPVAGEMIGHYVCWMSQNQIGRFSTRRLEEELRKNPHYDWARKIGQLGPLEVQAISPEGDFPLELKNLPTSYHRKESRLILDVFMASRRAEQCRIGVPSTPEPPGSP